MYMGFFKKLNKQIDKVADTTKKMVETGSNQVNDLKNQVTETTNKMVETGTNQVNDLKNQAVILLK